MNDDETQPAPPASPPRRFFRGFDRPGRTVGFCVAALLVLGFWWGGWLQRNLHIVPFSDMWSYREDGIALREQGWLKGNLYNHPIGYAIYSGIITGVFGNDNLTPFRLINLSCFVAVAILTGAFTLLTTGQPWSLLLGGLIVLLHDPYQRFVPLFMTDLFAMFWLALAAWLVMLILFRGKGGWGILAGAAFAGFYAGLIRPASWILMVATVPYWVRGALAREERARFIALTKAYAIFCLLLIAVVGRNYAASGQPYLTMAYEKYGAQSYYTPWNRGGEAVQMADLQAWTKRLRDEYGYPDTFAFNSEESLRMLAAFGATARKLDLFVSRFHTIFKGFGPWPAIALHNVFESVDLPRFDFMWEFVVALSLLALTIRRPEARFLAAAMLLHHAFYSLSQCNGRYRMPADMFLIALAAAGLSRAASGAAVWMRSNPRRLAMGRASVWGVIALVVAGSIGAWSVQRGAPNLSSPSIFRVWALGIPAKAPFLAIPEERLFRFPNQSAFGAEKTEWVSPWVLLPNPKHNAMMVDFDLFTEGDRDLHWNIGSEGAIAIEWGNYFREGWGATTIALYPEAGKKRHIGGVVDIPINAFFFRVRIRPPSLGNDFTISGLTLKTRRRAPWWEMLGL
ncbi:MAG: hypothetical protein NTW86_08120 [Candidatus Sumerlaeota bacterium]|nr:hypothetical protein [Candidatus Sumerlaeota bacterium]